MDKPLLDDPPQFKGELAPQGVDTVPPMSTVERLARDPNISVEKLERFMLMQERLLKQQAEADFNVAFARLLPKIPTIIERGRTDKGTYAPLEDIIEKVRPLLAADGFSLSFKTEWPDLKTVKVIGILTHIGGHSRQSEFLSGADTSGSKNAIQALASAVSYGKRYATKDLLCIVTRAEDDDAESSERAKQPEPPESFEPWMAALEAAAADGMAAFSDAWNKTHKTDSGKKCAQYLAKYRPRDLAALKTTAAKAKDAKAK